MARNEREPDAPVPVGAEENWNESQWFWWADPAKRICGFHRIAHQPNRGNAHIWNVLIDDTGRYTRRMSCEVAFLEEMRGERHYSVEGLTFRQIDQGGLVCEMHQDDVYADLTFEDLYRAVSFNELSPQTQSRSEQVMDGMAHDHLEVAGSVKGSITIGDRKIEVSGLGHRDHSWGARDVGTLQSSTWTNGSVGEEFSFFACAAAFHGGQLSKMGFVAEHGVVTLLKDWNLYPWMEIDGVTYHQVTGQLETVDGRRIDLQYTDLIGSGVVTLDEWIGFETAFNLTVDGKKKGVANFEREINPCGGQRLPTVVLNGVFEDGTGQMGTAG